MRLACKNLPYDLNHDANVTLLIPTVFLVSFRPTDFLRSVKLAPPAEVYLRHEWRRPSAYVHFVKKKLQQESEEARIHLAGDFIF